MQKRRSEKQHYAGAEEQESLLIQCSRSEVDQTSKYDASSIIKTGIILCQRATTHFNYLV
jgi:hypothetical protein